jgi:hypothetical protein
MWHRRLACEKAWTAYINHAKRIQFDQTEALPDPLLIFAAVRDVLD